VGVLAVHDGATTQYFYFFDGQDRFDEKAAESSSRGQYFDHEVWEEALENYPKKLNLCSSNSFEIV